MSNHTFFQIFSKTEDMTGPWSLLFWGTANFSTQASTTYIWKCSNLGSQTSLWPLGKSRGSKSAILAGKATAWSEAGDSGVQGRKRRDLSWEKECIWCKTKMDNTGNTWGRAFSLWHQDPGLVPVMEPRLFLCFISWLLICWRLGTDRPSTDPALQVPGNEAERTLPQALPGWLLFSLKWASQYLSVCIIQD